MNNQMLFRVGGIAALLTAVTYVVFPILFFSGSEVLAAIVYFISGLMFLVILIPLSLDLSSESKGLVIVGAILLAGSIIWGFFLDNININPLIFGVKSLIGGLGTVLYGWLQYRSDHYPNGMGIVALLSGVFNVIPGILLLGGADVDGLAGIFIPFITVLQLVWLIWLGVYYLRSKSATLMAA